MTAHSVLIRHAAFAASLAGLLLTTGPGASAQTAAPPPAATQASGPADWSRLTTGELIAQAPAEAWQEIPANRLMVLDFAPRAGAEPVRVVIHTAPAFAPRHVAALDGLLAAQFFDGKAIVRSQENYVAQWGDGDAAAAAGLAGARMPAEFDAPLPPGFAPLRLMDGDVYAPRVGFLDGWPVAFDPRARRMWLPHCYGMVGAGRAEAADSGGPAELYAVNGHSPRALDRNVTLLGRVVAGMEHLTTLPRGTEALGFYSDTQHRPVIVSARLASELPAGERPRLEALLTGHPVYREILESRRNRRDSWTLTKAGRLEICNAPLPVRPLAAR
jgi:peptidylprolyl isomerase